MAKTRNWKLIIIIAVLVLVALGVAGNAYMSTPGFCGSCHEMKPYLTSWQQSSHKDVNCLNCHSEPGLTGFVKEKIVGMRETIKHFTGFETPIQGHAFESRCYECHENIREVEKGKVVKVPHGLHLDNGMKCSSCHEGFVHGKEGEGPISPTHETCSSCHDTQNEATCNTCHQW